MEKVRLGGMALANGVLVHGPTAWAAAVRLSDGGIKVASGRKRRLLAHVEAPFARGPLRLTEAFLILPAMRRALPEARFSFEHPAVFTAVVVSAAVAAAARRSRLSTAARELVAAVASLTPVALSLRGGELASYHGAEHVSIGSYETGAQAPKEHDRCGSHLVGPLFLTSAAANALAAKAPSGSRGAARVAGAIGAVGASVEIFAWMHRHPRHPLARLLARPGHELQQRLSTAEPTAEQLEVAEAALDAYLVLER